MASKQTLGEELGSIIGTTYNNVSMAVSSFNNFVNRSCYLAGLGINDGLAKTLVLYDAVLSAGGNTNTIATLDAPAKGFLSVPTNCVNGFSISATSACNVTAYYL